MATLSSIGTFDLVHSFIVFQHISQARGEATLRELGRVLNPGGVGVLHFAYALKLRPWWLRDVIGALRTRALRLFGPIVEMYPYDLNASSRPFTKAGSRGSTSSSRTTTTTAQSFSSSVSRLKRAHLPH
jgi:SAM-dependent methyltransferase